MKILFWLSFLFIIYTYFGYPVLLLLAARLKKESPVNKKNILPSVSLIISAYNEEKCIAEKIENSFELDYPEDLLEVIIISDGSRDKTEEIITGISNPGLRSFFFTERKGKTAAQNFAVENSEREILVFTDANSLFKRDALKNLVRNFSDENIGGVCGELRYIRGDDKESKQSENLYWKLEIFIKKKESSLFSTLGANGAIYAIRRDLYTPLQEDIISDLLQGLSVLKKKYKMVYEKEAIATEKIISDYKQEFRRKQRIIMRSFYSLLKHFELCNPFKYGMISIGLISHKLVRWFIPFFLIAIFISNLFILDILFFKIFLYFQIAFYIISLIPFVFKVKSRLFYLPFYFCLVNCAAFLSIIKVFLGKKIVLWQPIRG